MGNIEIGKTYRDIKVEGIFSVLDICDFKINEAINEHSRVHLYGILPRDIGHSIIFESYERQTITIKIKRDAWITLFDGLIEQVDIHENNGLFFATVQAVSRTILMDEKINSQSFQNFSMNYTNIFEQLMEKYPKWRILNKNVKMEESIKKLIMQYDETDWQFAKRVVSLLGLGLIPSAKSEFIDFYIGMAKNSTYSIEHAQFIVSKHQEEISTSLQNGLITDVDEMEFIQYTLPKVLYDYDVGDIVIFKNRELVIIAKAGELNSQDALLWYTYTLTSEKGASQAKQFNYKILGITIGGTVVDNTHVYAKLHLSIDKKQELEDAMWFRQSVYHAAGDYRGWTAMYDCGDTVYLYFPTYEENDSYIMDSSMKRFADIENRTIFLDMLMTGGPVETLDEETIPQKKLIYSPKEQKVAVDNYDIVMTAGRNKTRLKLGKESPEKQENGMVIRTVENLFITGKNIDIGYKGKNIKKTTKQIIFTGAESVEMICGNSLAFFQADKPVVEYFSPMIDVKRWKKAKQNQSDANDFDEMIAELDINAGRNQAIVSDFTPGRFRGPVWSRAADAIRPVIVTATFDPVTGRLTYNININAFIDWERGCYVVLDEEGNPTDRVIWFDPDETDRSTITQEIVNAFNACDGVYSVKPNAFVRDGNNFTTWNTAGNNLTQVGGVNIAEIAYDFSLNVMSQANVDASRPPQNTINYGIGYHDAPPTVTGASTSERSNAIPGVPGRRNSANLGVTGGVGGISQYRANANNPNVYINVGFNDNELRRMRGNPRATPPIAPNYGRLTRTFVHETLHMLGVGDGYSIAGTTGDSREREGNTAIEDLAGDPLRSNNVGNIMSTPQANFTNVEAQKLHAAITTNDYQYYNFGVKGEEGSLNTNLDYTKRNNVSDGTYQVTGP